MKVGDLVLHRAVGQQTFAAYGFGIVLGFDEDGDPLVHFQFADNQSLTGDSCVVYWSHNIEVVDESR